MSSVHNNDFSWSVAPSSHVTVDRSSRAGLYQLSTRTSTPTCVANAICYMSCLFIVNTELLLFLCYVSSEKILLCPIFEGLFFVCSPTVLWTKPQKNPSFLFPRPTSLDNQVSSMNSSTKVQDLVYSNTSDALTNLTMCTKKKQLLCVCVCMCSPSTAELIGF